MKAVLSALCLAVPVAAAEVVVMTNATCPSAVSIFSATGAMPMQVILFAADGQTSPVPPMSILTFDTLQPRKLPPVPPALLARLSNPDIHAVTDAIARIDCDYDTNTRAVRNAFIGVLSRTTAVVRLAALDAIEHFDVKDPFVPALAACLNDVHEDIRSAACDVLFEIETKDALDVFVVNLTNDYGDVRSNSVDNVECHTRIGMPSEAAWRGWWSTNRASFEF